jgi:hypothetical protein
MCHTHNQSCAFSWILGCYWCSIFYPESKEMNRKLRREALLNLRKGEGTYHEYGDSLESNDFDDDDDDDVTVEDTMDPEGQVADHGGKHYNGWKPKYSLPIGSVTIRQQQKKTVHILIAIANVKEERDLLFDTVDDAQKFCREVEGQQKLENDRQEMRLQASLRDIKLPNFETITLLFEIVSAYDLPVGDFTTSDPYVVAMIKHRVIHRTKHIPNTYVTSPFPCCVSYQFTYHSLSNLFQWVCKIVIFAWL